MFALFYFGAFKGAGYRTIYDGIGSNILPWSKRVFTKLRFGGCTLDLICLEN